MFVTDFPFITQHNFFKTISKRSFLKCSFKLVTFAISTPRNGGLYSNICIPNTRTQEPITHRLLYRILFNNTVQETDALCGDTPCTLRNVETSQKVDKNTKVSAVLVKIQDQ